MNDKLVGTIRKTATKLEGENRKSAAAARKALGKYAAANPEEFAAAGLDAAQFPRHRNDVVKYGCLGGIVSVGAGNEPRLEMRAAHEYYNMLAAAAAPLVARYRKLLEGPEQRKLKRTAEAIDALYGEIGDILQRANFERVRKINPCAVDEAEPKVQKLREEIEGLKKQRRGMMKGVYAEMRGLRKENAAKLKAAGDEIAATVTATRANRPAALWFGNYMRVEEEFKQATDDVKDSPSFSESKMHFRYEKRDGSRPESLLTLPSWNGEGVLSTTLCNVGEGDEQRHAMRTVATVMGGTNQRVRFRPLTEGELPRFGLPPGFLKASGNGRMHVASIRNGKGWYEVVAVMHRPLGDPDDEVLEASYITRKTGLTHASHLTVTMKRLTTKAPAGAGKATVVPTWEQMPDGSVKVCEWRIGDESGFETIPASVKSGLDQAARLQKYLKAHVSIAQELLKDIAGGENPDAALPAGLHAQSRSQMRHAYRAWCRAICPEDSPEAQKQAFRLALRDMRETARKRHGRFYVGGDENGGNYGGDPAITNAIVSDKAMRLGLERKRAEAFAALLVFDERYVHLHPWSVNLREKRFAQRTDIYRNIAARIGRRVAAIAVPDADYRTRAMGELQAVASPSELVKWLKNYADREGLRFETFEEQSKAATAGE